MTVALLAALAALQAGARSTSVPDLNVGDVVRLETRTIAGRFVMGELRAANQGFVAMSVANTETDVSVPWTRITSLSRFTHRDKTAGVTAGLILGSAAAVVAAPSAIAVAALPAGGAAVGWISGPRRWRDVTWRPTMDTVMLEGEATRLKFPEGTRIMLRANRMMMRAQAIGVSDDSIFVRHDGERKAFAWRQTTDLRVRSGRSRLKGAAIGMVLGGMTGAAVFLLTDDREPRGTRMMRQIGRGVLIGTTAGFAIGVPGWTRMPFPVQ